MAAFVKLTNIGVWVGLEQHRVDVRQGHPHEVSHWLQGPDLAGVYSWDWDVQMVRSQHGEGGVKFPFLVISDPHTAMACKLRWG